MPDLFQNFASGVLSADPGSGTTLNSGNFAFLPVVASPNTLRLALDPDGSAGTPEIVTVTVHTAAATSLTVTRGQETAYGAGATRAHAVDTVWRMVLTHDSIGALANALYTAKGQLLAATGVAAASALTVGTNGQTLGADSSTATGLAWTTPIDSVAVMTTAQRNALAGADLFRGRTVFNSDTGGLEVYYGATTSWRPPWNTVWGELAYYTFAYPGLNTITTTPQNLVLGTPTFFLNRRYHITAQMGVNPGTATSVSGQLYVGATFLCPNSTKLTSAASSISFAGRYVGLGSGQALAINNVATDTGTASFINASDLVYIHATDIGPVGNAPAS